MIRPTLTSPIIFMIINLWDKLLKYQIKIKLNKIFLVFCLETCLMVYVMQFSRNPGFIESHQCMWRGTIKGIFSTYLTAEGKCIRVTEWTRCGQWRQWGSTNYWKLKKDICSICPGSGVFIKCPMSIKTRSKLVHGDIKFPPKIFDLAEFNSLSLTSF